ncbi:hypothetical protein ON064_00420 [Planococcus sp. A6]|uniref:hypothetical protein n=1 Tax=Planococcus sp. A6 TaxID=2992760 RepID=UPI00237B264A|nr:hypothetical protein [Planococcus sp. A6]MDE0581513.1 hypothetical protein [Planococcus sp. A6]
MDSNKKVSYKLGYEETTFIGLLKISGFKSIFNFSMLYSLLLTAALGTLIFQKNYLFVYKLAENLSPILLGAAATIFGIVLAALAVSISLFHPSVLYSLLEVKLLHKYLFPFWKAVSMWGINILLNLLLIIIVIAELKLKYSIEVLFTLNFFLFTYSTLYTVRLTGEIIRLTLQRAQLKLQ